MSYIGTPPANRVLSSADIAPGSVTLDDINFTDQPANMNIHGVIDSHTMRLAEGVTVTGDVTISDDLILAKISDDGVAMTLTSDDVATRTIIGSGSIQAASLTATPQPTQTYAVGSTLTGLTGTIGAGVTNNAGVSSGTIASGVTGGSGLSGMTSLGTVTTGTISTGTVIADATMTLGSDADGDMYYRSSNKLTRLPKGSDNQTLVMNGNVPNWETVSGGGGGVGAAGWTEDGWRFVTSTSYDYEDSTSHATYAHQGDFDREQHKGSNITESAGEITMATAGLYAISCLLIESHLAGSGELAGYLMHTDVSNSNTEIWYEPPIFANKGSSMSPIGSFTWFVNVGAGDKVHMRLRGYTMGNWCGSGSPSCCFQGCRVG